MSYSGSRTILILRARVDALETENDNLRAELVAVNQTFGAEVAQLKATIEHLTKEKENLTALLKAAPGASGQESSNGHEGSVVGDALAIGQDQSSVEVRSTFSETASAPDQFAPRILAVNGSIDAANKTKGVASRSIEHLSAYDGPSTKAAVGAQSLSLDDLATDVLSKPAGHKGVPHGAAIEGPGLTTATNPKAAHKSLRPAVATQDQGKSRSGKAQPKTRGLNPTSGTRQPDSATKKHARDASAVGRPSANGDEPRRAGQPSLASSANNELDSPAVPAIDSSPEPPNRKLKRPTAKGGRVSPSVLRKFPEQRPKEEDINVDGEWWVRDLQTGEVKVKYPESVVKVCPYELEKRRCPLLATFECRKIHLYQLKVYPCLGQAQDDAPTTEYKNDTPLRAPSRWPNITRPFKNEPKGHHWHKRR